MCEYVCLSIGGDILGNFGELSQLCTLCFCNQGKHIANNMSKEGRKDTQKFQFVRYALIGYGLDTSGHIPLYAYWAQRKNKVLIT